MVTVGEAYRVINNFENSTNKLPYFSDKQNFHIGNNYIIYEDQQIHWLEWLKTKDEDSDFKDVYNRQIARIIRTPHVSERLFVVIAS